MMNAAIINDVFERHLWHGKVLIIVSEKARYKTIYNYQLHETNEKQICQEKKSGNTLKSQTLF